MRARRQATELEHRCAEAERRVAELERELESRSLRDPLTGLPAPNVFFRQLEADVDHSRRHGSPLSVAVLDIDAFRAINTRHGRELGDRVLAAVAELLTSVTEGRNQLTRSSADEFIVALPGRDAAAGAEAVERLMLELEALRVGPLDCLSASAGVAE